MNNILNYTRIFRFGGILLTGMLLGWLLFGGASPDPASDTDRHVQEAHTDEQGNIVYTCSMHPSVRQNEPGNCPICGMELIPVGGDSQARGEDHSITLAMTHEAAKLAEIQTTTVVRGQATKESRLPGKVVVDERRISSVTAHFPGRIIQLYVDFTGKRVKKGEKLASIYSPELLTAQKELIEAKKYQEQNPALYAAARNKLKLWELPESEIDRIEKSESVTTQIDIVSPADGYVLKRNISREDHVMPGTIMYQIADLDKVWIAFNAYESDLMGLGTGDRVEFRVDAYPGEQFTADITFIDPVLDSNKRTVSVRAEANNEQNLLKPQMLVEGIISSVLYEGKEQILVPKTAVLWTGERSVVYVMKPDTEQPTFEFREVVLGPRVGDHYVIKSGVQAGEEVVTRGNFKIDSAAQLAGKTSMMNRGGDQSSTESNHQHSDHLDTLVSHYLKISESLAADNFEAAQKHLALFKKEVEGDMVSAVTQAGESESIETFRLAFKDISDNLLKALKNQDYDSKKLFLQYCPMAGEKGQKGAHWISNSEKIENPYMGTAMLTCGETVEEINR